MKKHIVIGLTLFVVDSFILCSGVIALILLILILGKILNRFLIKKSVFQKNDLIVNVVYVTVSVFIVMVNAANLKIAEHRANFLILTCENYREQYGKYPDRLSELVPIFLKEIPHAKYTLVENQFFYLSNGKQHALLYSVIPLGRRSYHFESHKWRMD